MSFDSTRYAIAPGEKAGAFVLRVLRAEGALDADSAILRSALKPLVAPVTFVHLVKSGHLIEAAIGDEPAFYAAAETSSSPASTEAPMNDAAPETTTETTAAAAVETTPAAPAPVTREPIDIVKPTVPLTDVHPGLTLQSVVLRAIHEAPRAVSGREVVEIVGCARPSVFQSISIAFKDGLLTRTEGEDPFHYATNPEKLAEVFEIINARGSAYPVWLRICESPADAETIAAATGLTESGVRAAVKSLLRNGWAFEDHKVGARKFYAGHAVKQAAVEDVEDEAVTGSEGATVEIAAVVEAPVAVVESAVLAPAVVVESAPAPAPVAAAPASTDVLDLLLATPKGRAAVSSAFSALAQLAAALAS
jgi:hypothetical protein